MPPLLSHSITDKGLQRDNNEDCILHRPDLGLWAVADGMGGHEAGEVASAITCNTIEQHRKDNLPLDRAILASHQAVIKAIESGQGAQGMGSTVVALQCQERNYTIAWVGDSRAYLWSTTSEGGQLEQLTTDHSYVQMLLDSGSIDAEEMEQHPDKNIITQCIGSFDNPDIHVDCYEGKWGAGQWIILCSDGLTDEVSNQQIAEILCDSESLSSATEQLIAAALDQGGSDNVSVQIIESPVPAGSTRTGITGNRATDLVVAAVLVFACVAFAYWCL